MMNQTKQIFGAVMPSGVIAFGHFRLRAAERLLEKDGVRLKLGSRALDILIALVERAPEVVSKRELLARAWPDLVVDEGSLRFHISVLRKVLGDGESRVAGIVSRRPLFAHEPSLRPPRA
jgi:DNA-binding winged helix-turn-helix (wHTH) protein